MGWRLGYLASWICFMAAMYVIVHSPVHSPGIETAVATLFVWSAFMLDAYASTTELIEKAAPKDDE